MHCGHIISLARLGVEYGLVKVVVLDYPDQEYSVSYRAQILREVCSNMKGRYEILVNSVHFGKITREQIESFNPFDVYGTGNHSVLLHVEKLGIPVVYVERAYDYNATDDRTFQRIKHAIEH